MIIPRRPDPWLSFILAATLALLLAILLGGCSWRDLCPCGPTPGPGPTPVDDLASTLTWAGGLAGFLGLVLGIATWLPAGALGPAGVIIAIAAPFARVIGYLGGAAFLTGWGISFLGRHPWVVACACLAAGAAWYLHRHPRVGGRILGWLKTRTAQMKPSTKS